MNERLTKLKYSHEALADFMITNPTMQHGDLAAVFDKSPGWMSTILNSKSFNILLNQRKEVLVDPTIRATLEDRINTMATLSSDVLIHKLSKHPETVDADLALRAFEKSSKALGYGLRPEANTQIQNNFVVAMPQKAESEAEWSGKYAGGVLEAGKQVNIQP